MLPKANTTREYWENILDKVDAITEIPSHRWDWRLYFDADRTAKDKIYSKWGGFLDDMPFDPMRYGMPPKSINSVDPMQLMALEVARQTLDDAGYHEKAFDRERASVILGASGGTGDVGSQYGLRSELPRFSGALPAEVADAAARVDRGLLRRHPAQRHRRPGRQPVQLRRRQLHHRRGLRLVAGRGLPGRHRADGGTQRLRHRRRRRHGAGPVRLPVLQQDAGAVAARPLPTFDASADGIVISEGIAMVALKRLADAERDGDRIYAVIKGVGGGSDGNAKGLTAPLPEGQLRAMRRAYAQAGFGPATVGLFEAHGTGTVAGDTAELESTTRADRRRPASRRARRRSARSRR